MIIIDQLVFRHNVYNIVGIFHGFVVFPKNWFGMWFETHSVLNQHNFHRNFFFFLFFFFNLWRQIFTLLHFIRVKGDNEFMVSGLFYGLCSFSFQIFHCLFFSLYILFAFLFDWSAVILFGIFFVRIST